MLSIIIKIYIDGTTIKHTNILLHDQTSTGVTEKRQETKCKHNQRNM